ncbi:MULTISPECIES: hypothetical protein [Antarcticibacterium]|uniref:hypothetical protein n=1 Tax=Antarcticibacterium TaxID=2058174 RepID=UPI00143D8F28|nr:hypothetical protein [Antarcticibacterium flavum]
MAENLSKQMYRTAFNTKTEITTVKLKEKIMTNREAMTAIINSAKSGRDNPKIIACFLMFRYTS